MFDHIIADANVLLNGVTPILYVTISTSVLVWLIHTMIIFALSFTLWSKRVKGSRFLKVGTKKAHGYMTSPIMSLVTIIFLQR